MPATTTSDSAAMWARLQDVAERFHEIEREMADPATSGNPSRLQTLAREHSSLQGKINLLNEYQSAADQLQQARDVLDEADDDEMRELALSEVTELREQIEQLEEAARRALLPRDPNDDRNVIVEIRAGAGGDEAGLWAADLLRAYVRYAEGRRWHTDVLSASENAMGGFKEVICQIDGNGAFSRLKYESGVHRVQRVPETEAQGRIHTSTATVAVMPEAEEVDVDLDESDIRLDLFHSGGAGGQNVNKVQTGVRLTHEPSGIVVTCTDERSQLKNKLKAMSVLRARLYEQQRIAAERERADFRRSQVGSGDRSEKIRTYNYPENRVTDHRIGLTRHDLNGMLEGNLDPLIDAAATAEEARLLAEASQ